jgi:hypothetical protein
VSRPVRWNVISTWRSHRRWNGYIRSRVIKEEEPEICELGGVPFGNSYQSTPGFLIYEKAEDLETQILYFRHLGLSRCVMSLREFYLQYNYHIRRKEEQQLLSKNRNNPIIMEIKPKMEKKTKLSFIYRFMPPKNERSWATATKNKYKRNRRKSSYNFSFTSWYWRK